MGQSPRGRKESDRTEQLHFHFHLPQYSDLEKSVVCIVHGVAKSRMRLSDFHLDIICLFIVHRSAGFVQYFQVRLTILRVCVLR